MLKYACEVKALLFKHSIQTTMSFSRLFEFDGWQLICDPFLTPLSGRMASVGKKS